MRRISVAGSGITVRARRWDAIVLGGALPGLAAAVCLAKARHRVLVIEEVAATRIPYPGREPFFLPNCEGGGILESCLGALGVPLIDRRRLERDPLAFQVVFPEARIDVGEPGATAEEFATWGLCDHATGRELLAELGEAAAAEQEAMLSASLVRSGGLRGLASRMSSSPAPPRHARGLPELAAHAPRPLAGVLQAQVRALCHLARATPPPEAEARLLGLALEGAATVPGASGSIRQLLERRIRELHGEFRTLRGGFEFVSTGSEAGLAVSGTSEIWLARALLLNAPQTALVRVLKQHERSVPEFLSQVAPEPSRARVHLRVDPEFIPEGMARRVIVVSDPSAPQSGGNLVTIALHPSEEGPVDLVARARPPDNGESREEIESSVLETLSHLMPFAANHWTRLASPIPVWDDDELLADPIHGQGWPGDVEIRLSSRPLVCGLPREAVACLGLEGDLLLGWRAGDAVASDLA